MLKSSLTKKYKTKDLREIKMIIGQQIYRDLTAGIIKINQSAFIQDLVIIEGLTNCNANITSIKAG